MKKIIKRFDFLPDEVYRLDLTGGLVVNRKAKGLELPASNDSQGPFSILRPYSLDQTLTARTWITNPKALTQWVTFQVEFRKDPPWTNPNVSGTPVTIQFRLSDGTDDLWWDGAAWSVAGVGEWNSEHEIAANIATFPVTDRKLGVVVNMYTLDSKVSPRIRALKLLYEAELVEEWDLVYNSLLPAIKNAVRPQARAVYQLEVDSSTIDFSDTRALGFDTGYNIVDVTSAFDYTNDPTLLVDIRQSFASSILTLSSELEAGSQVYVNFTYEPTVTVLTSRDYSEIATIPSICITRLTYRDTISAGSSLSSEDAVHDLETGIGWAIPGPRVFDLNAVIEVVTDKQFDGYGLAHAIREWIARNPLLIMTGTDEGYQILSEGVYEDTSEPNEDDLRQYRIPISIANVPSNDLAATPSVKPTKIVFVGGNMTFTPQ